MSNQMTVLLLYTCISLAFCQAANAGKSLFLLYALKRSPRLTLFYLYLFDYSETFLPFLHTCCPAITHIDQSVESSFLNTQVTLCKLPACTVSLLNVALKGKGGNILYFCYCQQIL